MLDTAQLIARYGNPVTDTALFEKTWMIYYTVPDEIHVQIPHIPKVIYMNRDVVASFEGVLLSLIKAGVQGEWKTWDGCFNIRDQRGSTDLSSHAFGISVDGNSAWNPFRIRTTETDAQWAIVRTQIVKWSPAFLQVWRDCHWFPGADWIHRIDGMHFQAM